MWSANLARAQDYPDDNRPSFTFIPGGQRYSNFPLSKEAGIPSVEKITASSELLKGHIFEEFISREKFLSHHEIKAIRDDARLNLTIRGFESGAVPASANPSTSYATHIWTRDSAYVAFALLRSGHTAEAKQVVSALAHYYGGPEQRERLLSFHFHQDPAEKYRRGELLPMIRSPIDSEGKFVTKLHDKNGNLISNGEHWGHAQLDALGEWLWTTFRFANQDRLDLRQLDKEIGEKTNHWNKVESVFIVATRFLHHVKCWDQMDLGPWEEKQAHRRASSLGMIKAGLIEMRNYFNQQGWDALKIAPAQDQSDATKQFKLLLEDLYSRVDTALQARIPHGSNDFALETDTPSVAPYDAALSLLLYPFEAEFTPQQEANILRSVYTLMGEVGFCRYKGDEYVGMDYIQHGRALKGKVEAPGYREAEWCIFDPVLAGYYFRRFEDSGGSDLEAYAFGQAHLKRSLAQVTAKSDDYQIAGSSEQIQIPVGTAPEAYFFDSKENRWRPNSNSPLNWTKSVLALALSRAESASQMFEAN